MARPRLRRIKGIKMFDIKAQLERQCTRNGGKVLAIFDSGLDISHPVVVWADNSGSPFSLTRNGCLYIDGHPHCYDVITLPKEAPVSVSWVNIYPDGLKSIISSSYAQASGIRTHEAIATVEITFDPNTGESSAETVWVRP